MSYESYDMIRMNVILTALNHDPRKNNATNVTGIITFGNVMITVRPDTTGLST